MEITFIGHSCFKIKGNTTTIIIDPYNPKKVGYKLPKLTANIVLVTHEHDDHNYVEGVSDYKFLINSPGEYETQGTFVFGLATFHDAATGADRGKNTIYLIEIDGFNVLHLGDLGHELSKEILEKITQVDVLLVPVGGTYTINAKQAIKVIASLEPGIVVPMHYATPDLSFASDLLGLDKFLQEMGLEKDVSTTDRLKLNHSSDIPEDSDVVILKPQH